jgi:protein phosphatase
VAAAQAAILAHRRADPALREMASTFVGALTDGRHLWVATLGDSPVYHVRAGQAVRLVGPHLRSTTVGTVVTRYLGDGTGPEELEAEIGGQDRIVLCSDGLSDVVPPPRIAELVAGMDAEPATCALLSEALRRQTSDNVTSATIAVDAGNVGRLSRAARAFLPGLLSMP